MLKVSVGNIVLYLVFIVIIIICVIGIIISIIFQMKKEKRYKECLDIIKENENATFQVKFGLTKEEINKIDSSVDVDKLMKNLYDTYLRLINNIRNNDKKLDDILCGIIKDVYIKKLENFKLNGYSEIIDNIDLIEYSITEFSKDKLKFRITINCVDYKLLNGNIVSGNNLIKLEEVILLSFEKRKEMWLITQYEKLYEKKLSN